MGDRLKEKTIHALKWTTIDRFGQQLIQFVIGLILARWFIKPDQQGLFGAVVVFSTLAFVFVESGFTQALIRKKEVNETEYNSVFYFNLAIAVFLYIFLFLLFPYLAVHFFKEPALINIGRVSFLTIIITSLYLVPIAQKTKELDFKTIAVINIISIIIAGSVAVFLGVNNFGVWALVAQQLVSAFVHFAGYYMAIKWKPKLIFDIRVIREFGKFSFFLLFTSILNVLFNNIFVFILGRKSIMEVGLYNKANQLSETSNSTFQSVFSNSVFPVFSQIQDDSDRQIRIYREFSKKISIITFPTILTLIAIANPLIIILLTDVWADAIPYYQILCLVSLFASLYTLTVNALNSQGESKISFKIEIIKKSLILVFLAVGFPFGIKYMLLGYAAGAILSYFVSMFYLKKHIGHYIKHQIADFIFPLIAGMAIGGCCYVLNFLISNLWVLLSVQFFAFIVLYYSTIRIFYPAIYQQVKEFILLKIKRMQ